eukprot:SAG22_NODE_199_length_15450_cov_11.690704_8_plen_185_part_01
MHGVKKETLDKMPPEKLAARAKKTAQYRALSQAVMSRRAKKQYDEESLGLTNKLLEVNPEAYTVWNYRRELLSGLFAGKPDEEVQAVCEKELQFLEGCLLKNPKAYTTWEHRLWTVRKNPDTKGPAKELALCTKFLKYDERNFHCWGYRKQMAVLAGMAGAGAEPGAEPGAGGSSSDGGGGCGGG